MFKQSNELIGGKITKIENIVKNINASINSDFNKSYLQLIWKR